MSSLDKEIEKLKKWDEAYYAGNPAVSDALYDSERDRILEKLRKENPNHPYLSSVGASVPEGGNWPKFTHTEVMGSLFKVNSRDEFIKWAKNKGNNYFLAEKADGWTLAAYYEKGKLKTLATRGDGIIGDDVTGNAKYFTNMKMSLADDFSGIIRGEAIIHTSDFEKHFAPLNYSNPRNSAGKIRDTENHDLKKYITIKWFDVICDKVFKTWGDKVKYLKKLGLETIPYYDNLTPDQVWSQYQEYSNKKRAALNYWIDGLVVRINDIEQHDNAGITDNRPKGSVAFKFPSNGVKTILLDVIFNRGKSGRMTPVGLIHPVEIDGTTVTKASLHGQDWINELGLQIGDEVEVAKAGDIIPQIIRVIAHTKNSKPIDYPTTCPYCNETLQKNGAYLECSNSDCHGELVGSIGKWVEKTGIKGIGEAMVIALADRITDVSELYSKGEELFISASGSEKIGKKVYKEIEKTRTMPLEVFLSALHIDSLGDTNGQRLTKKFKTLAKVLSATEEEIKQIDGIDANSNKICEGLKQKKTLIAKFENLIEIEGIAEGDLSGMNFCITGTLSKGRNEVEAWIKQRGGVCQGNVSKDTTYLITDDPNSGSSKNQKADKYGVKKITEDQLYQLTTSSSDKQVEQIPIKKFKESTLFDNDTEESAWIEVEATKPNHYTIVRTSFTEPDKIYFVSWNQDIDNLDQKVEYRSTHLKLKDLEIKRNKIIAPDYTAVKKLVSQILFDAET